jgi:hypothetical protein
MDGHFYHWMLSLLVGAALVACGGDSPLGGGGTGGGAGIRCTNPVW